MIAMNLIRQYSHLKAINSKCLQKVTIILVCCFLFFNHNTFASHQFGADITYNCIGKDSFLVKLTFFEDCTGITAGNTSHISVYSPTCGSLPNLTVIRQPGAIRDITPLCPGWPSPCNGPSTILPIGVEEFIYTGLLVLPSSPAPFPCHDWILSFQQCCRTGAITTGAANQNFYISTALNQSVKPCNSSPQFGNDPIPFYCTGRQYHLNPGVYDPDGDSLSFSLVPCRQSNSSIVIYQSPLSASQPISTTGPVTIDPVTGTVSFIPNMVSIGLICIKVDEFRNGVKIGEVNRDVQIYVIACNNPPPVASGMNCTNKFDTTICPGQAISFTICSSDSNSTNSVKMRWNSGIPAGTFTTSTAQFPVGTFSWTPTLDDIGTHFFTVNVRDNACPYVGTNSFAYVINVRSVPINLGTTIRICEGDTVSFKRLRPYFYTSYQWTPATGVSDPNALNVVLSPSVTTTYTLTATRGACVYERELTIIVKKRKKLFKSPLIETCREDPLELLDHELVDSWIPPGYDLREIPELPIEMQQGPGTIIPVVIKDDFGCEYIDSIRVRFRDKPAGGIMVLHAEDNTLELTSVNTHAGYQWSNRQGEVLSDQNSLLLEDEANQGTIFLTYWDEFGCRATDSFTVRKHGFRVVLPNVFKPGSSIAANKTFGILESGDFDMQYFRIYDPESQLIFETNNMQIKWDGTYNGSPLPEGNYSYELSGTDLSTGKPHMQTGFVTLLQ